LYQAKLSEAVLTSVTFVSSQVRNG